MFFCVVVVVGSVAPKEASESLSIRKSQHGVLSHQGLVGYLPVFGTCCRYKFVANL